MRRLNLFMAAAAICMLMAGTAAAETKVTLKGVHLCCGQCVKVANKAVKDVKGATIKVDKKKKSITVTADDKKAAQKTLDALAKAGFHGTSDKKKIKIKDDSGVKKGKVKRIELFGAHNCCGGCASAIKKICGKVGGVKTTTIKAKAKSFVVEGDFDGLALVKALNKAGLHVKAKKKKK